MPDLQLLYAAAAASTIVLIASCTPTSYGPPQTAIPGYAQQVPAGTGALLYVTNAEDIALTYTFPQGKRKGKIGLAGYSVDYPCSDGIGNVWIPENAPNQIVEYTHGGSKPIKTLRDSAQPLSCAVDPQNGDLAVVNSSDSSTLSIYKGANGNPKNHSDPAMEHMYFCGYDGSGNLFVDGTNASRVFKFAELPKGGSTFRNLSGVAGIVSAGSVQWDGSYITVTDNSLDVLYRFTISGKKAKAVGTTTLSGANGLLQTWIDDGKMAGVNYENLSYSYVAIWNYPKGGSPAKTFALSSGSLPGTWLGLTVSVSPKR